MRQSHWNSSHRTRTAPESSRARGALARPSGGESGGAHRRGRGVLAQAWEGRRSMEEEVLQPDDAGGLDDDSGAARAAPVVAPVTVPVRAAKRDWALRSVIKGARPARARRPAPDAHRLC